MEKRKPPPKEPVSPGAVWQDVYENGTALCAGQHGRCSPHGASLMHINYIQFLKSQLLLISSTTLSLELAHKAAVATRGERLPC